MRPFASRRFTRRTVFGGRQCDPVQRRPVTFRHRICYNSPQSNHWSEKDLEGIAAEEGKEQDEKLGAAWRSTFEHDIDNLYDYVDRGHEQEERKLQTILGLPKSVWEGSGLALDLQHFPEGLAGDIIGLGCWRLKGAVDGIVEFLAARIEHSCREFLDSDMSLYPPQKWKDKGWDFVDSVDPERGWGGWAYADIPDPENGESGYPRLQIENRMYCSRVFRKIHLELAYRQDDLSIFHLVMYPRYDYDMPILGMDVVIAKGQVTLATIDVFPVRANQQLPQHYVEAVEKLQSHFLTDSSRQRVQPEWLQSICSSVCVLIRPESAEDLAGFIKYSIAMTRAYLMYSQGVFPLDKLIKQHSERLDDILNSHKTFCQHHLKNRQTSHALETSFGSEFQQEYMSKLMFDFDPSDKAEYHDGSVADLYKYFEEVPEEWPDAEEFKEIKRRIDDNKAKQYLQDFMLGESRVRDHQLSWALMHMFNTEPVFQRAVADLLPNSGEALSSDTLGSELLDRLKSLAANDQHQERNGT